MLISIPCEQDERFMKRAIQEAERAFDQDEVPVGCVIVVDNKIIGRGHNQVECLKDPTAHAEIIAITAACEYLGSKYLDEATLYVTLEPCIMCSGAIIWSRIKRLVFGCTDPKKGFLTGKSTISSELTKHLDITYPMLQIECNAILKDFFRQKR